MDTLPKIIQNTGVKISLNNDFHYFEKGVTATLYKVSCMLRYIYCDPTKPRISGETLHLKSNFMFELSPLSSMKEGVENKVQSKYFSSQKLSLNEGKVLY